MDKKKKKIILIVLATIVGSYACFWTAAQIHNHYNPPVAVDGAESGRKYMEYIRKQQKENINE